MLTVNVGDQLDCLFNGRWERVRILEVDSQPQRYGRPECMHVNTELLRPIYVFRCDCGTVYARLYRGVRRAPHLCRACDHSRIIAAQRKRRATKPRLEHLPCATCGASMKAARSTSKYCSTSCRVAAWRHRHFTGAA